MGYRDDYLPFCDADKATGELTGALKDYLAHASNCLKNAAVSFEATPYPSTDAAFEAMQHGEIDCVFPVNLSTYTGEMMGVLTVNPIMKTEISVLVRTDDRPEIAPGKELTVAIDEGNVNSETLVKAEIPNWTIKNYPSVDACCRAVAAGGGRRIRCSPAITV